jgi:hypothetical protein
VFFFPLICKKRFVVLLSDECKGGVHPLKSLFLLSNDVFSGELTSIFREWTVLNIY